MNWFEIFAVCVFIVVFYLMTLYFVGRLCNPKSTKPGDIMFDGFIRIFVLAVVGMAIFGAITIFWEIVKLISAWVG